MTPFDDVSDYAIEIVPNIGRSDSDGEDPSTCKPRVPSLITLRVGAEFVGQAIHFHGERRLVAIEVEIVRTVFVLPSKFKAIRPELQRVPQPPFGRRHGSAERACTGDAQEDPSTILRMVPLPSKSRGG